MTDGLRVYCEDCDETHVIDPDADGDETVTDPSGAETADEDTIETDETPDAGDETADTGDGDEPDATADDFAGDLDDLDDLDADDFGGDDAETADDAGDATDGETPDDADDGRGAGQGAGDDTGDADDTDPSDLIDRSETREVSRAGADDAGTSAVDWSGVASDIARPDGIQQAKERRDAALAAGGAVNGEFGLSPRTDAETVRSALKTSGLAEEIRDEFAGLTRPSAPRPSRSGSDINKTAAKRLVSGDTSARHRLYERQDDPETATRTVSVGLDCSGSMRKMAGNSGNSRMDVAKYALGALAVAADEIGDEFVASGFAESEAQAGPEGKEVKVGKVSTPLISGPDEEFSWRHMDAVAAGGGTTFVRGLRTARRRAELGRESDNLIVMICDGDPSDPEKFNPTGHEKHPDDPTWWQCHPDNTTVDRGDMSRRERAGAEVTAVRNDGAAVVGIGIGDVTADAMSTIFGSDGYVMASADDLAEKLVQVYRGQLSR